MWYTGNPSKCTEVQNEKTHQLQHVHRHSAVIAVLVLHMRVHDKSGNQVPTLRQEGWAGGGALWQAILKPDHGFHVPTGPMEATEGAFLHSAGTAPNSKLPFL